VTVRRTFSATIEQAGDSGGAYVTIPFDAEQVFGSKRVPVQATIDGVAYRGSLVRMGGTCHVLGVLKEIRERIGKGPGDVVEVTVEEDVTPRRIQVPADLADAFSAAPDAGRAFEALSYTRQREFVGWIEEAKRGATRAKRIARTVELLEQGEKTVRPARTSQ
jgi:bifunctional DNA-binding transcriptional regulator/antitoxin component of YhaV-PrlF toxin-antitoxin module